LGAAGASLLGGGVSGAASQQRRLGARSSWVQKGHTQYALGRGAIGGLVVVQLL